ncbi:MAG: hypothetical protein IPO09_14100 [Anaeromyxobacter sp.]|nr:hypothetical protein [Anaeromyxobacter sp.]MBL0275321.1 hypothetical protein [Anaeromyxobacter sp.]
MPSDPLRLALLLVPLFALGAAAGALRGLALRQPPGPGRRRRSIGWVLLLLVGAPVWLVLAALLRVW